MTATGKRMRKQTGMTHAALHKSKHTHKSSAKIRRAGWHRAPAKGSQ